MNKTLLVLLLAWPMAAHSAEAPGARRAGRFDAAQPDAATRWQQQARQKLFSLMMGGSRPARVAAKPVSVRREEMPGRDWVIEELSIQTLPDRTAHVWMARPREVRGQRPGVLAIHGHGGSGEEVVRGQSLYWYGRTLAEAGCVVIAPDVGSHTLQHTNWSLMGERVWDSLCTLDYLAGLPFVDPDQLAVAGLSLGGETTMYVAALDERLKLVCSSGWLTTVENMKQGHCPCWNFPRLEEHFDFADIFACVAPRQLICEIGERERAPGGFPVPVARRAFAEIRSAYRVFQAEDQAQLVIHPGGHIFEGALFFNSVSNRFGLNPAAAKPTQP